MCFPAKTLSVKMLRKKQVTCRKQDIISRLFISIADSQISGVCRIKSTIFTILFTIKDPFDENSRYAGDEQGLIKKNPIDKYLSASFYIFLFI